MLTQLLMPKITLKTPKTGIQLFVHDLIILSITYVQSTYRICYLYSRNGKQNKTRMFLFTSKVIDI